MEDLNKKIKELRNVLGMTQAQFAEKLELTQSNLSAIEGGKREVNLNIVMNIKEKFKISIEDFLYKDIYQIDIHKYDRFIENTHKSIAQQRKIDEGVYKNENERAHILHQKFTKDMLSKYHLEEIEDFIYDFDLAALMCNNLGNYQLICQTSEDFDLFHSKLITKDELILRYEEAINKEKELYQILLPYYETILELANKIFKFEYGDIDIDD